MLCVVVNGGLMIFRNKSTNVRRREEKRDTNTNRATSFFYKMCGVCVNGCA